MSMPYHNGGSPGGGITKPKLSMEPLATEEEATFGDDESNPYDLRERRREMEQVQRDQEQNDFGGPLFDTIDPSPTDMGEAEPELPSLW